jgi:hypothetical protein
MQLWPIILIAGSVLIVIAILVFAISYGTLLDSLSNETTYISDTIITPNKLASTRVQITDTQNPIGVGIRTGIPLISNIVNMKQTITDPNGLVVKNNKILQLPFYTLFMPLTTGTYTITISDSGTKPASFALFVGKIENIINPNTSNLIITSIILFIIGIIATIVGAIIMKNSHKTKIMR